MNNLIKSLCFLIIVGCNSSANKKKHFSNNGVTTILNGKNETDSLKYTCDSCYEILKDKTVFDTIIFIASAEAKERLKNKLSFRPISVDLILLRQDSTYYTSGKRIDSLVAVIASYKCIGKNGYGVEDEVENSSVIYLINNEVTNLEGKIKKEPLALGNNGSVSRNLSLYGDDGSIIIQPVKINGTIHLIVTTDESCVEDTRLRIGFSEDDEIALNSWNDFNCKNTSYFRLNNSYLDKLKSNPILYVTFSGDDFIICHVPENQKDYFIQYASLLR